MIQIKALLVAAACCVAIPAFAADANKTSEQTKATKPEATKAATTKRAEPKEKFAGDVKQPVITRDTAVAVNGATLQKKPYNLANESWVYDEDEKGAR